MLPQFIGAPPSGSINYTWEYSYDGINYQTLATSQNAEYFHNCFEEEPLSVMIRLTIRLTIQFSNPSYDPIIVHHKIEIVDEIDGIPCIEQQLVSINETSDYKDIELHIYPNPAISIIDFQVIKKNPTQDYQNLNAKIINLQYVPLASLNLDVDSDEKTLGSFNIENIPAGSYFIVIHNKERIISIKKFIVVK